PKPDVPYDLATHCDAIEELVTEHRPRAIVGHSMGAIIGLELFRRFPDIPVGVMVSPAVFASADEAERAFARHHRVGALTLPSRPLGRLSCAVMCHLRPILRPILPMFARDLPADVVKAGLDHNWHSMSRSLDKVVWAGLVPGLMAQVGGRVTVIHGTDDQTVPVGNVEQLRGSSLEFSRVDGGHLLPLYSPEVVASAVLGRLMDTSD
ncbi:MAG: alpha/beta fold hydrolase, partial [Pirellulales bacterium]